jgi:cytosine/adenosine deaminase-related metal-dependent hydrolase
MEMIDLQSSEPPSLVIRGCDVLIRPGEFRASVDISVRGDRIVAIDSTGRDALPPVTVVLDGTNLLAIPGLINAHAHSPETCLRGSGEGLPLEVWLTRMFGTSEAFEPDDHYVCALGGAMEMLLSGGTSILDHLWMTGPTVARADAALRAYRDIGIRAAVAPLVADRDDTAALAKQLGFDMTGALYTDLAGAISQADATAQLEELILRWHDGESRRLQVLAGPCSVQWCSDEMLTSLAETARRHDSSLTIHTLETRLQLELGHVRFGKSAVHGLDQLGILDERCSLAHGVWLDADDISLLADRGAVVVHNAATNLRLASGRAPVREMLDAGVTVALGSDGTSSSDNQNLWVQLKLASLIHNDGERWLGGADAIVMCTQGGAAALGLRGKLGTLAPGSLADIVLLDRDGDGLMGVQDLEAGLALSETGRGVRHVIVAGELVVANGRCLRIDEQAVREAVSEQVKKRYRSCHTVSPELAVTMERVAEFRRLVLGQAV